METASKWPKTQNHLNTTKEVYRVDYSIHRPKLPSNSHALLSLYTPRRKKWPCLSFHPFRWRCSYVGKVKIRFLQVNACVRCKNLNMKAAVIRFNPVQHNKPMVIKVKISSTTSRTQTQAAAIWIFKITHQRVVCLPGKFPLANLILQGNINSLAMRPSEKVSKNSRIHKICPSWIMKTCNKRKTTICWMARIICQLLKSKLSITKIRQSRKQLTLKETYRCLIGNPWSILKPSFSSKIPS